MTSTKGGGVRDEPHVLLDATAVPENRMGVGRYVDNLVQALDEQGAALTVVCQHRDGETFAGLAPSSRIVPVAEELDSRPARLGWEQTTLPRLARKLGADVVHSPHYTMPLACPVPTVVTLHDATFFSDRNLHLGVKGRFFRAWTRVSLRRAAVCIVPSEASADELVRLATASRNQLHVAHHGVDPARFRRPAESEIAALREELGLGDRRWIAFLGTLEPRKNVPALIRGFVRAVAGTEDPPVLVLAGSPGWDSTIDAVVAQVPPELTVLRTGHLPVELLSALLGGATVVAYPSLGEGFGLPVLEAMACGAAVLTTRRLALPEVGGDAVAYTGIGAGEIAAALTELLDDPQRREQLSADALARAATFTWAASAREHHTAYERAAEEGRRA